MLDHDRHSLGLVLAEDLRKSTDSWIDDLDLVEATVVVGSLGFEEVLRQVEQLLEELDALLGALDPMDPQHLQALREGAPAFVRILTRDAPLNSLLQLLENFQCGR